MLLKVFGIYLLLNAQVNGLICRGCLELDELTFDKVLAKFPTVLVKFDIAFPYGKQHDQYEKFAAEISKLNLMDMIVSVVGIKNYGDPTNDKLVGRFEIGDQLPAIKLFTSTKQPIDYPKGFYFSIISVLVPNLNFNSSVDLNITVDNLQQFVRRQSNVKITLNDCLEQFDEYAMKFIETITRTSVHSDETAAIMNDAQLKATKLPTANVCISLLFFSVLIDVLSLFFR